MGMSSKQTVSRKEYRRKDNRVLYVFQQRRLAQLVNELWKSSPLWLSTRTAPPCAP